MPTGPAPPAPPGRPGPVRAGRAGQVGAARPWPARQAQRAARRHVPAGVPAGRVGAMGGSSLRSGRCPGRVGGLPGGVCSGVCSGGVVGVCSGVGLIRSRACAGSERGPAPSFVFGPGQTDGEREGEGSVWRRKQERERRKKGEGRERVAERKGGRARVDGGRKGADARRATLGQRGRERGAAFAAGPSTHGRVQAPWQTLRSAIAIVGSGGALRAFAGRRRLDVASPSQDSLAQRCGICVARGRAFG